MNIKYHIRNWSKQINESREEMVEKFDNFDFNKYFSNDIDALRENVKNELGMELENFFEYTVNSIFDFVNAKDKHGVRKLGDAYSDAEWNIINNKNIDILDSMLQHVLEEFDENERVTIDDILSDENTKYWVDTVESYVNDYAMDNSEYYDDDWNHHEEGPDEDYYGI